MENQEKMDFQDETETLDDQEEMDGEVTEVKMDFQAEMVNLVKWEAQEKLVLMENEALMVNWEALDCQEEMVVLDDQVYVVTLELEEIPEMLEHQVQMGNLAVMVFLVEIWMDDLGMQEILVHEENLEQMVLLEKPEEMVMQVEMDTPDVKVILETEVCLELTENVEILVPQENLEHLLLKKDLLVIQEILDEATLDHPD